MDIAPCKQEVSSARSTSPRIFHTACVTTRIDQDTHMHHPTLHLQPTEVMTGETTTRKKASLLGTSQHWPCESPIISQQSLRMLVDGAHLLLELVWHDCVRLCMWLSHTAEKHAHTITHLFSLSDQLTATPIQEHISFWIHGASHGIRGR